MVEEVVEVVVVPITSPRAARSLQTAERVTGSVGWETDTSRPYLRRSGSREAAYRKLMGVKCLNLGQKQQKMKRKIKKMKGAIHCTEVGFTLGALLWESLDHLILGLGQRRS